MIFSIIQAIESDEAKTKIAQLFDEYYSLMMSVAKAILKDHALAEDAVSDSILKIIHNLHKIGEITCYKTRRLIVIIVRNTAINIYNREVKTDASNEIDINDIVDTAPLVYDEVASKEGYSKIVEILNSLPDSLKDIAILSILYEWSHKEIEELTGLNPATIRMKVFRARKLIKTKLGQR